MNERVSYFDYLTYAWKRLESDTLLNTYHRALYWAIFHRWNQNFFKEFEHSRQKLMDGSGIRSQTTYFNTLNDLVKFRYITYEQGLNQHQKSLITVVTTEDYYKGFITNAEVIEDSATPSYEQAEVSATPSGGQASNGATPPDELAGKINKPNFNILSQLATPDIDFSTSYIKATKVLATPSDGQATNSATPSGGQAIISATPSGGQATNSATPSDGQAIISATPSDGVALYIVSDSLSSSSTKELNKTSSTSIENNNILKNKKNACEKISEENPENENFTENSENINPEDSHVTDNPCEVSENETPQTEDSQTEDPKIEDSENDDPQIEDSQIEDSQIEDSQTEDSEIEDPKNDDPKKEDPKKKVPRTKVPKKPREVLPKGFTFIESDIGTLAALTDYIKNESVYPDADASYYFGAISDWRDKNTALPPVRLNWKLVVNQFFRSDIARFGKVTTSQFNNTYGKSNSTIRDQQLQAQLVDIDKQLDRLFGK